MKDFYTLALALALLLKYGVLLLFFVSRHIRILIGFCRGRGRFDFLADVHSSFD